MPIMTIKTVYEFYVELTDITPKIHRTFQVESDMELSKFIETIQEMFEMDGSHLSQLLIPVADNQAISEGKTRKKKQFYSLRRKDDTRIFSQEYGYWREEEKISDFYFNSDFNFGDFDEDDDDEEEIKIIRISDLISEKKHMIYMEYDFGDSWVLWIVLKKIHEQQKVKSKEFPKVLKGEGFGIIEDCGGTYGLQGIINKKGDYYEEFFAGTDFDELDFSIFDAEIKNKDIKKRLSRS